MCVLCMYKGNTYKHRQRKCAYTQNGEVDVVEESTRSVAKQSLSMGSEALVGLRTDVRAM